MKSVRPFAAIVGVLTLLFLASGCESFGNHRKVEKDAPQDITEREPFDPTKKPEKTSWSPGSWSSEARDIEKNMMRNSADPNW